MIHRILILLLLSIPVVLCKSQPAVDCTIDLGTRFQQIDNFGASDCWSAQFVGNWPESKKQAIADLLFSQDLDPKGKPKGIGLSLWRFNIGAGSQDQGTSSGITTDWRRTECVLQPDGSYNWSKQAGQQWFLKAAAQRGVNYFLAFSNTPPVFYTKNGLGFNKEGGQNLNLLPEKYDLFADYLTKFLTGIKQHTGIEFNYISPLNEPEWDWDGNTQEGTPAQSTEIASIVRKLNQKLSNTDLKTKIIVSESGQLDYLYKSGTNKPGRDNQIQGFYNKTSPDYLGNLSHIQPLIAGHAYWTDYPISTMIRKRMELKPELEKYKLDYWQTEYCIMGQNPEMEGSHKDLTMHTALYVARLIHHDLVTENAAAWHWWLAITYSDYKDGLIYVNANTDKTDGTYSDSKLLWAFGNYSRFIRPGALRVKVVSKTDINNPEALMVSSYYLTKEKQVVTVIINYCERATSMHLSIPGATCRNMKAFITSDLPEENLAPKNIDYSGNIIEIPGKSVVTVVEDIL